ncbi:O-antigen ligase family protein [Leptolyngbya sp. AN02str]|uniref:O-antigen ligase family protein n=1 Tax=Leptolyngbya sp. AN02str TaxID=3423363 RepID=UPI003D315A29
MTAEKAMGTSSWLFRVFRLGLATIPYVSYVGMAGVGAALIGLLATYRRSGLNRLTHRSLLVLSGLMVLSSAIAYNRGEAFLQLANFLPYFVLFAMLPFLLPTLWHFERIARDMVLTMLPINLLGIVEYWLKSPRVPFALQATPFVQWLQSAPHKGRAMVFFDHPNVYASYLVPIFGLGLGLLWQELVSRDRKPWTWSWKSPGLWVLLATVSCLPGIFASGSRNGLVVAIGQMVVFLVLLLLNRASKRAMLGGILGIVAIIGSAALLGIGGRSLSPATWANDPRVNIWRIALDLIRDRPLFGWGLGNYKIVYQTRDFDPAWPNIFHPHNMWLLLGSEAGLIITIGLSALVGYFCYRAVMAMLVQPATSPSAAIMLGYLFGVGGCFAYALFDVTFYDVRVNLLNWLLLAGLYHFGQSKQAQREP